MMDLAQAHLKALDRLRQGADSFAWNLSTGTGVSVKEILDAVETVAGRPAPHSLPDARGMRRNWSPTHVWRVSS